MTCCMLVGHKVYCLVSCQCLFIVSFCKVPVYCILLCIFFVWMLMSLLFCGLCFVNCIILPYWFGNFPFLSKSRVYWNVGPVMMCILVPILSPIYYKSSSIWEWGGIRVNSFIMLNRLHEISPFLCWKLTSWRGVSMQWPGGFSLFFPTNATLSTRAFGSAI